MTRAELILYATTTGPLAQALAQVYERISHVEATTAQDYPPHCTLTGFFHRDPLEIERINEELQAALEDGGPMPPNAVEVAALHRRADWVGLELRSAWLTQVTEQFVARHVLGDGDEPLRPKGWLHLSIAYGNGEHDHAVQATQYFDELLPATWEVALWQRLADGTFSRICSDG